MWFGSGGLWLFSSVIAVTERKPPSEKSKAIFTSEQHRKACLKWVNTELQSLKELRENKIVEYCARCGCELPDSDEIYWVYGQPYCADCDNDEIEETDYPFIEDL